MIFALSELEAEVKILFENHAKGTAYWMIADGGVPPDCETLHRNKPYSYHQGEETCPNDISIVTPGSCEETEEETTTEIYTTSSLFETTTSTTTTATTTTAT